MKTLFSLGFAAALITVFTGCRRDATENNLPGNVKIEFEHVLDDEAIELNQWILSGSDSMSFSQFKYYISNIQLINVNGDVWSEPNSYHLIDLSDESSTLLSLTGVSKGDYSSVRFVIGIDSTKNYSGDHSGSLSLDNGMYWNPTDGYQFIQMGGSSSFVSTGLFDYQLGGNSSTVGALQTKSFDLNGAVLTINSEVSPQLHLAWDAAAFVANAASFGDVPLINSPSASGHEFSAAFSNAWGFEHLHQ